MVRGRTAVAIVAVLATVAASPGVAYAAKGGGRGGGGGSVGTGIDVSYPQCPGTGLPAAEAFAVVGVNGGLANDYNGCLGTEFSYALGLKATTSQPGAQVYVNTADPGNGVADWPSPAQEGAASSASDPYGVCGYAGGSSGPGADDQACAWAYGYDMVAGIGSVSGDEAAFAAATGRQLASQPVWLDVETTNSWLSGSAGQAMNTADLQGMVAAVRADGSAGSTVPIGVYSTSYQWGQIVGTTALGTLGGLPVWLPGARSERAAQSNCAAASFTGGRVTLTQWTATYDEDYPCP